MKKFLFLSVIGFTTLTLLGDSEIQYETETIHKIVLSKFSDKDVIEYIEDGKTNRISIAEAKEAFYEYKIEVNGR